VTERGALASAVARRRLHGGLEPLAALEALRADGGAWLLESALPGHPLSRFSFAGADPYAVLRGWAQPAGPRVEITCTRDVRPDLHVGRRVRYVPTLEALRELLPPSPQGAPDALPFVGGAVGWLGYELAQDLDRVSLRAADDLGLPDAAMLFVDRLVAFDHEAGEAWAVGLGFADDAAGARRRAEQAAQSLAARLHGAGAAPSPATGGRPRPVDARGAFDESSYPKAVEAIREQIALGRVYQACLTQRLEAAFEGDALDLYCTLRERNPAPFAAFLELPEAAVVGSSPERFLCVGSDGAVESRPIKGTRPRGDTFEEDAALRRALLASEKDRAENLMIVDLVRNDLGRVCRTGSVRVPVLFRLEAFATVHQMVSVVEGRLRTDRDALDAVAAAFPPGSMTGAPKLAALEILDALEPVRRGVYSGALGYLDARGGLDLSVVIRTLLVRGGRAWIHAGGGVVSDSHPLAEYRESLDKARALLEALAACPEPIPSQPGAPRGKSLQAPFSRFP
jgi:para-aminobenzoate synthetase component 1